MRGHRAKAYVFDDFFDMPKEDADAAIMACNVLSKEALEEAVQAFTNAWVKNKESIQRHDLKEETNGLLFGITENLLSAEEVMQIFKNAPVYAVIHSSDENEYVAPRAYPEIDGDEFLKFISNESTCKK